jgi:hypothetical protein
MQCFPHNPLIPQPVPAASGGTSSDARRFGAAVISSVVLAGASLWAAPAQAQGQAGQPDVCKGRWVRELAGPHAITKKPMNDLASLQNRLAELEPSIRIAVAKDRSLDPAVADAVIAAIRSGNGVTERQFVAGDDVKWMAFQPQRGVIEVISPPCMQLKKSYDAFAIEVSIPDPAPTTTATAANCSITATRDCASTNPTINVSIAGSSPNARVTVTSNDQPPTPVSGVGQSWSIPDAGPYDRDLTYTVRAQGTAGPARTARVYRFLMPKVCGNLSYLGEGPVATLSPATAPATCEDSVRVDRCAGAPPPPPPEVDDEVASCTESEWVARPMLFGFMPDGSQERDLNLPAYGPAAESFELEDGFGVGFSIERRLGPVLGIEAGFLFGRGDTTYTVTAATASESDTHTANFYALMVGPNFHLTECGGVDFYVGPFIGYGGYADPNYWALDHHFHAAFDGRFIWGAQLGLDVPFDDGPWGFHGGVRWIDLAQDTDAGEIAVDPLIVELGLSYWF